MSFIIPLCFPSRFGRIFNTWGPELPPLLLREFFRFVKWPRLQVSKGKRSFNYGRWIYVHRFHVDQFSRFFWKKTLLRSFRWWPMHSEYERKSIIFPFIEFLCCLGAQQQNPLGQRWGLSKQTLQRQGA